MARFKVMGEIVEGRSLFSHMVMHSIHKTKWFNRMKSGEWQKKNKDEALEETVEIKFTIDGEEFNPLEYFDKVETEFDTMVEMEATKILKERTSEKLVDFQNKMHEMGEVLENWAEDINWDYKYDEPNPFNKRDIETLRVPSNLASSVIHHPKFDKKEKVHDWRNYVPGDAQENWSDLTKRERAIIYNMAKVQADNEEWN